MLTQEQLTMMAENVAHIRENMAAAAREAGRDPADILLCAACKTRTVEEVIASAALPIDLFGENHVQELVEAGAFYRPFADQQGQQSGGPCCFD